MNNDRFTKEAERIVDHLHTLRDEECSAIVPFMNGDFTQWDLYLASSSEYVMRLIDGFVPMLESRNLVCVAQLLRAQIGACLRTFALFAAENQDAFLECAFSGGRVDRMKDRSGEKMSDARLKELFGHYDPRVKEVYDSTSGFVHFSSSILSSMGVSKDNHSVEFNFGAKPNEGNNTVLLECGLAFCHYADLHLQMLRKVIASDDWYANRSSIERDGSADASFPEN